MVFVSAKQVAAAGFKSSPRVICGKFRKIMVQDVEMMQRLSAPVRTNKIQLGALRSLAKEAKKTVLGK